MVELTLVPRLSLILPIFRIENSVMCFRAQVSCSGLENIVTCIYELMNRIYLFLSLFR